MSYDNRTAAAPTHKHAGDILEAGKIAAKVLEGKEVSSEDLTRMAEVMDFLAEREANLTRVLKAIDSLTQVTDSLKNT